MQVLSLSVPDHLYFVPFSQVCKECVWRRGWKDPCTLFQSVVNGDFLTKLIFYIFQRRLWDGFKNEYGVFCTCEKCEKIDDSLGMCMRNLQRGGSIHV